MWAIRSTDTVPSREKKVQWDGLSLLKSFRLRPGACKCKPVQESWSKSGRDPQVIGSDFLRAKMSDRANTWRAFKMLLDCAAAGVLAEESNRQLVCGHANCTRCPA